MLVVSRKIGESLVIADNIKVTIVATSGDKVSIGIDAPRDISILRSELVETIADNQAATRQSLGAEDMKGLAALLKSKNK